MKFAITGADANTGEDRHVVVEAGDEATALAVAKTQGLFTSRVELVPEMTTPSPPPNVRDAVVPATIADSTDQVVDSPLELSDLFYLIAGITFLADIIGGLAVGSEKDAITGGIVFAAGCLWSVLLLAVAKVLAYLSESVRLLRDIVRFLESKK